MPYLASPIGASGLGPDGWRMAPPGAGYPWIGPDGRYYTNEQYQAAHNYGNAGITGAQNLELANQSAQTLNDLRGSTNQLIQRLTGSIASGNLTGGTGQLPPGSPPPSMPERINVDALMNWRPNLPTPEMPQAAGAGTFGAVDLSRVPLPPRAQMRGTLPPPPRLGAAPGRVQAGALPAMPQMRRTGPIPQPGRAAGRDDLIDGLLAFFRQRGGR